MTTPNIPTTFRLGELFSGPGGIGTGAKLATIEGHPEYKITHQWANDYDADTCRTYARNVVGDINSPSVIHGDIKGVRTSLRDHQSYMKLTLRLRRVIYLLEKTVLHASVTLDSRGSRRLRQPLRNILTKSEEQAVGRCGGQHQSNFAMGARLRRRMYTALL